MTKTRIIGHRGAAGLELENTLPSFERAISVGAKIIELDVRTTLDNQLVICHDDSLERVSNSKKLIHELTLAELRDIPLANGTTVPLLREVLDVARRRKAAVIVEVKAVSDIAAFCTTLDAYQDLDITVASFNHHLLAEVRQLRPGYRLYLTELHRPVAVLQAAKRLKAQGVDLHYMLMNPLTYLIARRWNLDLMLYTVNNKFIARFLMFLYPKVMICTNYPDQFVIKKPRAVRARA
jgi:glycerophosphoryl diester phosphodiesterase